jgi:hypothetical protein
MRETVGVSSRNSEVEKILKRLQAACRSKLSDQRGGRSGRVPEDLATEDIRWLQLSADEEVLYQAAQQALLEDLRFEYMDEREARDKLWRFVCQSVIDRSHDHVRTFVVAHAREVLNLICYLPVEHLALESELELQGVRLLPLTSDETPKPGRHFSLEPPVGTVAAVPVQGTNYARMAERAREEAGHVLRVLRVALRAHFAIVDRQLWFTFGEGYAFDDRLSGWQTRDTAAYELSFDPSLDDLVRQSPIASMPLVPRNQLERKADLALRWIERAQLATEPLVRLLYLFFALEGLLGDKAEGLKAPVLAFRRAMLGEATGHGFTHPNVTFLLYDQVRSAAVHGGEVPEVTDDVFGKFAWDVRDALNEYLTYGAAEGFTKQSQLVQALDSHPEHDRMYQWLRENGGDIWAAYLESSFTSELRDLLASTISKARQLANANEAWETPAVSSLAGKEMAAEEARRPEPATGSWPWLLAPVLSRLALQTALEEAKGFLAVLARPGTSYVPDVLCRSVLETSSLAWWLLDPDIDSKTRLARSLSYRLYSAEQTKKGINALGLAPEDDPSELGELPEAVMEDIRGAQIPMDQSGRPLYSANERRLGYTDRVASLVVKIWPQTKLPYAVLSAVAHAELVGLVRNIAQREPRLRVAPGVGTATWLWQDAYLVIGALLFTTERAAAFLGLGDELAALGEWMQESQRRLLDVRPKDYSVPRSSPSSV